MLIFGAMGVGAVACGGGSSTGSPEPTTTSLTPQVVSTTTTADTITISTVGSPPDEPAAKEPAAGGNYTVADGDVLSQIASRFGTTVDAILAANNLDNPDLIRPGQVLIIPGQ